MVWLRLSSRGIQCHFVASSRRRILMRVMMESIVKKCGDMSNVFNDWTSMCGCVSSIDILDTEFVSDILRKSGFHAQD